MGGPPNKRAQAEKQSNGSSNGSSESRNATQQSAPKSIPRLDGNRDPGMRKPVEYMATNDLKNLSEFLGLEGWYKARGITVPHKLPQRPQSFNPHGKAVGIVLNTFNVIKSPNTVVHQYDLHFTGDGTDYTKRALLKKIFYSRSVQKELGTNNKWIWDTNKIAWSDKRLEREDTRISVDLDEEEGRQTKPGARGNKHTLHIRWTRKVDFIGLNAFLQGQASWSSDCIDTLNFLDHVMREWPSKQYTMIKKSFFQRGEQRFDLGGGIEAFKGVFTSLRPVLDDKFNKSLSVNVDVANGTFWRSQELARAIGQAFNCSPPQFSNMFKNAARDWKASMLKKDLRKFKRLGVSAMHTKPPTQWTIDEFVNMDASQARFPDPDDRSKMISVAEYFKKKYSITVMAGMPVVKMTKMIRKQPVYMPIDVLKIDANQRYNTKLSDTQTSNMIKFAVTLPKDRWAAVQQGVRLLNWANDPYLSHFGIQVNPNPSKVQARVLPPPTVQFGAGSKEMTIKPSDMIQGRWRLDGRKFILTNKNNDRAIRAWGVCCVQGRGSPPLQAVETFCQKFVQIYESHGGVVASHPQFGKKPWMGPGNLADGGEMVQKVWNMTGNRYNAPPSLLIFIVNDRNIDVYRRIKKSCDIRFGVVSQVLQAKHVMSASPQYISNVCMKVNAKLGGATCVAKSQLIPKIAPKAASIPTMVVGADVSHPAPGAGSGEAASFAAMTMSSDIHFTRYWAEVQTNGNRVEMVTTANIDQQFGFMAKNWMQKLGQGRPPQRVLYIRDGVGEGQYAAVLEEEVHDMKECFKKLGCKEVPKFTVVIAGKRHHVRFFPEHGDRNSNPLPGTLVESGCTHPFEFDFYLCSHVAIKGTARPIHYQCILNEGEWLPTELQQFIFEHSYHYVRSTTPVSLHPAVYYAHLAADRSRAHLNENPVSSGKKETKIEQQSSTGSSKQNVEIAPLMPMNNSRGIKDVMWYI
ncbi:uncharacterized protein SETTUDRAFT_159260 [Exserohilum turcica Et28A]|uniref:Piwi-domain-containing protein n=1 Tax=Exserohilum turcicum (strain 28A) TaxID=671987 RepID=R0IYR3_EXST2|nr:uncharacterized protein SETTUDRAFT_159260 [Exserohilum turcica Et28A]EOA89671.1 hypothetical protein SETTUDRAFT_159260 [Exserohilum turcica Et28A]